jgi:hypothetical protein
MVRIRYSPTGLIEQRRLQCCPETSTAEVLVENAAEKFVDNGDGIAPHCFR